MGRCRRTCRGRGGCRTTRCRGRAAPAASGLPTLRLRLASLEGLRSRSLPSLQRLPTLPLGSPQLEAHQSVSVPVLCQRAVQWTVCGCGVPTRLHIQLYRSRFVIGLLVRSKPIQILQFDGSISELVEMEQVCETLGTQNLYTRVVQCVMMHVANSWILGFYDILSRSLALCSE